MYVIDFRWWERCRPTDGLQDPWLHHSQRRIWEREKENVCVWDSFFLPVGCTVAAVSGQRPVKHLKNVLLNITTDQTPHRVYIIYLFFWFCTPFDISGLPVILLLHPALHQRLALLQNLQRQPPGMQRQALETQNCVWHTGLCKNCGERFFKPRLVTAYLSFSTLRGVRSVVILCKAFSTCSTDR